VAGALAVIKGMGEGPHITELRRRYGSTITSTMQSAMWALLLLVVVSVGALVAEDGKPGTLSLTIVYGSLVLGALRLVRLVWMIGLILSVGDADDKLRALKSERRVPQPRSAHRDVG